MMVGKNELGVWTGLEAFMAGTCFTTHTPVPAGNDAFPMHLIEQYLGDYMHKMGVDRNAFAALGRHHPTNDSESFGMTVLALKFPYTSTDVIKLNGTDPRNMLR